MSVRGCALAASLVLAVLAGGRPAAASPPTLRDGAAAYSQGRLDRARAIFHQVAVTRPGEHHAWLWLGVVEFQRKDYGRAEQAFGRAAHLAPQDASVHLWWGHSLAKLQRPEEAARAFERALLARGSLKVYDLAQQALRAMRPLPALPVAGPVGQPSRSGPAAPAWVLNLDSYRTLAKHYNSSLSVVESDAIARAILGYSRHFNLDPRLVVALIAVESGFQPRALSRAGAMGLGQLMPGTARALGVNPWDPVQNVYGAIRYLRGNLDQFGWGNTHLALAAYNAGRGAVERYEGIPPFAETQWYVANVTSLYRRLMAIRGEMSELHRRL
ncbi:MAG: transglycosylase SLT domain-containing protein [Armatimonadota bacterium]|nr:transglycosylase SLT domain-containing protein [Armatimonadota bacterium]